jgi:hypothetical protein
MAVIGIGIENILKPGFTVNIPRELDDNTVEGKLESLFDCQKMRDKMSMCKRRLQDCGGYFENCHHP